MNEELVTANEYYASKASSPRAAKHYIGLGQELAVFRVTKREADRFSLDREVYPYYSVLMDEQGIIDGGPMSEDEAETETLPHLIDDRAYL